MRLLDIDLGDARIVLYHIECAVTKQRLQREHIAARSQIRDREGVPETMGMTMLDARLFTQMNNQQAQGVLIHWTIIFDQEQRCFSIFTIFALGQITPYGAARCFAQKHGPTLAAFGPARYAMPDLYSTGLQINIPDSQGREFRGAQTRIQQSKDDGLIAFGGGAAHDELASIGGLDLFAVFTGLEQGFNFFFAERLDLSHLKLRRGNGFDRIQQVELAIGPGVEYRQAHVDAVDRLAGKRLITAGNSLGLIVVAQPDQKTTQVVGFDPIDRNIAGEFQPESQELLVALERIGAQPFGRFVLQKTDGGFGQG
jgi:hypothetical protein